MNSRLLIIWSCVTLLLSACEQAKEAPDDHDESLSVSIMTFNVENLFDNHDDPGKDDKAYLAFADKQSADHQASCRTIEVPRWQDECLNLDWSDDIVDSKLRAVAAVILQVNDGMGPDIIALQEVENLGILERLRNDYLSAAGYRPGILIEGRDERGVDVAFLSRFDLATPPTLHQITFTADYDDREADTRGILQADFLLPDETVLSGFAVHFPAPYHPTEMRTDAYNRLNEIAASLPPERPRFAAGDFNTTTAEDSAQSMLEQLARPHWTVAHDLGCEACKGTNYYARDNSWSFLDMILWSQGVARGENATWSLRETAVWIANNTPEQLRPDGTPKRFSTPEGTGVSDHWPLVATIERK